MTAAITRHDPSHNGIVETFRFTQDQRKLIRDTCCGGASEQDVQALMGIAEMRGLNPLTQECYFVQRWDSAKQRMVWAVQISIDAMRIKAEESGLYAGQDEAEFEYEPDGRTIKLARVKVYRRDWDRPCVGVARYSEYVQRKKDGTVTKFWHDMPHNQLAKCAESLALRKAFPARLAKLYTAEEMAQAETAPDPQPQRRSDPPPALHEGGDSSALWSKMSADISQAPTRDVLKTLKADVKKALDKGLITLSQRANLGDLLNARYKALKAGEPVETILAGNDMPAAYGGPADVDSATEELCMVCKRPLGKYPTVQIETADGEVGWRHAGCQNPDEGP